MLLPQRTLNSGATVLCCFGCCISVVVRHYHMAFARMFPDILREARSHLTFYPQGGNNTSTNIP